MSHQERIDRLAVDVELIRELAASGFGGENWEMLANVLAEYGVSVFDGWMRAGVLYERLAGKNVRAPRLPDWALADPEVRVELAVGTVSAALHVFRTDILPNRKWQPSRGAALSTYFIGQCMFRFGNVAQAWLRESKERITTPVPDDDLIRLSDRAPVRSVEDDVIRDETAQQVLAGATPRGARAMVMLTHGYSHAEIAAELGCTTKSVSSLLEREYRKARRTLTQLREDGTA
ncbi:hypothetical protein [Ornithinimicrobium panacihumi]|uniref:hypothetical protein n=1 Tax=Ornithinimicrobium panacihumi TaxID=2008449 RepID=UPI003F8C5252